ncbi:MAG: hypothetical protein K0S76_1872 [Herbinix sp.]|nr:hypothetical protein [Herbinix sp.]
MKHVGSFNNLVINKTGNKAKLLVDGIELKFVTDYKIKSSTHGRAELNVTMIVNFPVLPE